MTFVHKALIKKPNIFSKVADNSSIVVNLTVYSPLLKGLYANFYRFLLSAVVKLWQRAKHIVENTIKCGAFIPG